jgi:hypothetical protein
LGYGVTTYIVFATTSGWPSCPRSTPVEKAHATLRFAAFCGVMDASSLYRELA